MRIYDMKTAFSNMCKMSKDIVIIVVPFSQIHHGESIPDYWRFTPQGMDKLFKENGFDILYSSWNNHRNSAVYLFYIGSKNAEKWRGVEVFRERTVKEGLCGQRIGSSKNDTIKKLKTKLRNHRILKGFKGEEH